MCFWGTPEHLISTYELKSYSGFVQDIAFAFTTLEHNSSMVLSVNELSRRRVNKSRDYQIASSRAQILVWSSAMLGLSYSQCSVGKGIQYLPIGHASTISLSPLLSDYNYDRGARVVKMPRVIDHISRTNVNKITNIVHPIRSKQPKTQT